MPGVLWIVQTNLGQDSDVRKWIDALSAEGIAYREIDDIPPMSDEAPDVACDGPVVCYGTTNFTEACRRRGRYVPGVWHDDENFTYTAWVEHLGELLLNSPDATVSTTIARFVDWDEPDHRLVFVRPERDVKEFPGEVKTVGEFREFCRDVVRSGGAYFQLSGDTAVVVGEPYGISAEWRFFVVDGEPVSASQYRRQGRLYTVEGAPDDVWDFARTVSERWSPAPVFTLDICRSADNLYVVEAQGFNSAGCYAADLRPVVRRVSERAVRDHRAWRILSLAQAVKDGTAGTTDITELSDEELIARYPAIMPGGR